MDDKMNESKTILNLSTIPIKVMDSEYYTHWFPIEEINQIQNGKEKRKVNLKIVKNDKLLKNKSKSKSKEKKRISPLKRKDIKKAQSARDYSYFKLREMKEENQNHFQQKKRSPHKNNKIEKKVNKKDNKTDNFKEQLQKITSKMLTPKAKKNLLMSPIKTNSQGKRRKSQRERKTIKNIHTPVFSNILPELQETKIKRSQIIFDYYGIQTSSSDGYTFK